MCGQVKADGKKADSKKAVPQHPCPDNVETQQWSPHEVNDFAPPWSPIHKLTLTPKTPSTPAPGILKKSSDMTMATQLDEEHGKHEHAEEEEAAFDPCVCPGHDDMVIDLESGDESCMSPAKVPSHEKENVHSGDVQHDGSAVEGDDTQAPAAATPQESQTGLEAMMAEVISDDDTADKTKGTFKARWVGLR